MHRLVDAGCREPMPPAHRRFLHIAITLCKRFDWQGGQLLPIATRNTEAKADMERQCEIHIRKLVLRIQVHRFGDNPPTINIGVNIGGVLKIRTFLYVYLKKVKLHGYSNTRNDEFVDFAIKDFLEQTDGLRPEGMTPKLAFFAATVEELNDELRPCPLCRARSTRSTNFYTTW
jgi:hypothetical protein